MNYFLFFIFLFNNVIKNIFSKEQNLFEIIMNNQKSKVDYESSYIINDALKNIFDTKIESFHIPIYISIIDLTNINRLNISNNRDSYFNNYNNLLGVSDRVFIKDKNNKNSNKNKNKIFKVFLNGTIGIKNNSYLDEMIYNKIIFEKEDYNIDLYFLRNRYMSQYQNINEQNQKLFKFYDLNIVFYNNENNLYKDIHSNDLVLLQKIEINLNLTEKDISKTINNFINDFLNDSIPIKLKEKISTWLKIRNDFNEILKLEQCKVNLYNFLLIPEIKEIKTKIENIEKNLIQVLFFNENKDINYIEFNKSINDLKYSLEKYTINQSDAKIDFYFSIITIISIALVIFLCYKIYKEFQFSYFTKIK